MHVLLVHQNFVAPHQSGNGRAIPQISEWLRRGWKVTVITTHFGYLDDNAAADSPREIVERSGNLDVHRLPLPAGATPLRRRARACMDFCIAAHAYAKKLQRPSLVFATSPPLPQVMVSLRLARHFRCPMVFEVRDLWPALLVQTKLVPNLPALLLLEAMEALAYSCAAAVIGVTPVFRDYLEAFGVPAQKISIIPTGASPLADFDSVRSRVQWRAEQNLADETAILYAGSFNEHYGIDHLLKAAERLAREDSSIIWFFAGSGRSIEAVRAKARACPAIRYLGNLPKLELYPALFGADIAINSYTVCPLVDATMPGKVFDYMAAGLPIISLPAGHSSDLIRAADCGLNVNPGHEAELIAAVKQLATLSNDERAAVGLKGQRWILESVNAQEMTSNLADIVERAASASPVTTATIYKGLFAAMTAVLSRRSRRVVDSLFGADRQGRISRSFELWLQQHPTRRSVAPDVLVSS